LSPQLLDLGLQLLVSLDHPVHAAGPVVVLQLLDLLLQILNMFLGSLSDVSLGLTVIGAFASELRLAEVCD
jgi:hypothetical protein